jgi:hypothetical protein
MLLPAANLLTFSSSTLAAAMLKARHAAERLQGAWHGGLSSIDQLRGRMQDCLAEFAVSRDEAEVPPSPMCTWTTLSLQHWWPVHCAEQWW